MNQTKQAIPEELELSRSRTRTLLFNHNEKLSSPPSVIAVLYERVIERPVT